MLFRLCHPPLCFEIPDDWWVRSGAAGYKATETCFRYHSAPSTVATCIAELATVAPMLRRPGVNRNAFGFRADGLDGEEGGMMGVLKAIVSGTSLPTVQVSKTRTSAEGFGFKVRNGFHRFYASHALGFTHLPCGLVLDDRPEPNFGE